MDPKFSLPPAGATGFTNPSWLRHMAESWSNEKKKPQIAELLRLDESLEPKSVFFTTLLSETNALVTRICRSSLMIPYDPLFPIFFVACHGAHQTRQARDTTPYSRPVAVELSPAAICRTSHHEVIEGLDILVTSRKPAGNQQETIYELQIITGVMLMKNSVMQCFQMLSRFYRDWDNHPRCWWHLMINPWGWVWPCWPGLTKVLPRWIRGKQGGDRQPAHTGEDDGNHWPARPMERWSPPNGEFQAVYGCLRGF